jgi:hypothetical protein
MVSLEVLAVSTRRGVARVDPQWCCPRGPIVVLPASTRRGEVRTMMAADR